MKRVDAALVAALCTAGLDAWIGTLFGLDSLRFLVWSAGAAFLAVLPLFLLLAWTPLPRESARPALMLLVAATLVLWRLLDPAGPPSPWAPVVRAVAAGAGGAAIAVATLRSGPWGAAPALALPPILALTCVASWFLLHAARPTPARVLAVGVAWALGAAAVAWAARSAFLKRHARLSLGGLAILLVLAAVPVARPEAPFRLQSRTAGPAPTPTGVRHVLLITVDTLRADRVSSIHEGRTRTPHIDGLAADGVVFTQARSSAPWTLPAMASMMTGLPPDLLDVSRTDLRLRRHDTLARRLRAAGYATAAVGHNLVLRPEVGLTQGFSEYHFYPRRAQSGRSLGADLLRRLLPGRFGHRARTTAELTDDALVWIALHRDRSFFFWLHYLDPHAPYAPPEAFLSGSAPTDRIGRRFGEGHRIREGSFAPNTAERAWLRTLYDAEVRYVDDRVGRLLDGLVELGLYDDVLIVFASDHGEEFWEHGSYEHGHSLFDEVLRVPLIVKLPGGAPRSRIATPVSTQSVFATILEVCGIESPPFSAPSLVPLWNADGAEAPPVVGSSLLYFDEQTSVVSGGYKYIRNESTGEESLFDLGADPGETRSLAAERARELEAARGALQLHERAVARLGELLQLGEPESVEVDEGTRELLRQLGYVD